jgi:hypothetical protein
VTPSLFLVFDVESVGLHGEGFAVGWVVVTPDDELDRGRLACDPVDAQGTDEDRAWIGANLPRLPANCASPHEVRGRFWDVWREWKARGAVLVADCAWPVEARFLAACVDDDREARKWAGPYPLHDVATARLAAGLDPLASEERRPGEEPKHCPLADARQSARLFLEALSARSSA